MLGMKVGCLVIVAAQIVKPGHHSNIVIKLNTARRCVLADLFDNKLEKLSRELVLLLFHSALEFVKIYIATAVLIHHQKVLILVI